MTKYRDLLCERYPNDINIGSIAGCGLDRLQRDVTESEIEQAVNFYQAFSIVLDAVAKTERRQAVADYISTGLVSNWVHSHWLEQSSPLTESLAEPIYAAIQDFIWLINRHVGICHNSRREAAERFDEIQAAVEIMQRMVWVCRDKLDLREVYILDLAKANVAGVFTNHEAIIREWEALCRLLAETLGMPLVITGQNQQVINQPIDWASFASLGIKHNLLERQRFTGRQVLVKAPAE